MFLLSFENGLLYVTYKNAINFWLAKNVRFYCVLPYKTAIGSSWGGGDHIYIYIYISQDRTHILLRWETQLSVAKKLLQRATCLKSGTHIFSEAVSKHLRRWRVPEERNMKHEKIFRRAEAFSNQANSKTWKKSGWIGASAWSKGLTGDYIWTHIRNTKIYAWIKMCVYLIIDVLYKFMSNFVFSSFCVVAVSCPCGREQFWFLQRLLLQRRNQQRRRVQTWFIRSSTALCFSPTAESFGVSAKLGPWAVIPQGSARFRGSK